jgi:hypothetical protein
VKSIGLNEIQFPIYRIREFQEITTKLGRTSIKYRNKWTVIDDTTVDGNLGRRRLILSYSGLDMYPLMEQLKTLRQMLKYPSKTNFIDWDGHLFKYKKTSKLHTVTSYPIEKCTINGGWTLIRVGPGDQDYAVSENLQKQGITHASIMMTNSGPFLYDLTSEYHDPYRRKI